MKLSSKINSTMARVAVFVLVNIVIGAGVATAQDVGVFVSSTTINGNIGGLTGADAICQSEGSSTYPSFAGPWKAWLSDSSMDARTRIAEPDAGGSYVRAADGTTVIAADLAALTNAGSVPLQNAIELTPGVLVWTGTDGSGNRGAEAAGQGFCNDWTAALSMNNARKGEAFRTDARWTDQGGLSCSNGTAALYCFAAESPVVVPAAPAPAVVSMTALLIAGGALYLYRRRRAVG